MTVTRVNDAGLNVRQPGELGDGGRDGAGERLERQIDFSVGESVDGDDVVFRHAEGVYKDMILVPNKTAADSRADAKHRHMRIVREGCCLP